MSYLDDFLMQLHLQGVFGPNSMSANQMQQQQPQQLPINTFNPNLIGRAGYGVDPQWSAPDPLPINQFNSSMFGNQQQQQYGNEYKPKTEMNDRFAALLDQFPERTEQGILKKIAIALSAGFGSGGDIGQAAQAAELMKNAGFNRQLSDWKNKIVPVQQAADNERLSNAQERMYFDQAGRIRQSERKQEEVERANQIRESQRQQQINDQIKRTEILNFKKDHPSWKVITSKGGTVQFYNPQDPSQTIDSKIPTGTLDDLTRMTLQLDQDLTKIDARADDELIQIGARGAVESGLIKERIAGQKEVKQTVPGANPSGTALRAPTSSQERIRIRNRAEQLIREKPEWAKYIEFGTGNSVGIVPFAPGMFSNGGTPPEIARQIKDYIDGPTAPNSNQVNIVPPAVKYDAKVEAVIADAIKTGMTREAVIIALRQRGIIK